MLSLSAHQKHSRKTNNKHQRSYEENIKTSYQGDHATRANVIHQRHAHDAHHAPQALEIRVLASPQEDLIAHEVGAVVHHEAAVVHPAGVAAVQVHVDVGAVGAALIGTTLEVPLLIENNLQQRKHTENLQLHQNTQE